MNLALIHEALNHAITNYAMMGWDTTPLEQAIVELGCVHAGTGRLEPDATEHMLVRYINYLNAQMAQANTSPQRKADLAETIKAAKADLEALRIRIATSDTYADC